MKLRYLYILIFIALGISSCDTFSTRTPDDPTQGTTTYKPATSLEILIDNLKLSMNNSDLNIYYSMFPEPQDSINYEFVPSNNTVANYADIFKDWTVEKEKRYFNNFIAEINKNVKSSFVLTLSSQVDYPNYSSIILKYNAFYPRTNKLSINLVGTSQLDLIKTQKGIWKISKWIDNPTSDLVDSASTWSLLKGIYSY